MNEHEWINMDHLDIWSAVEAGDINKLQELINYRALRQDEIGKLTIGNPWALLLLAIISRNLEVVKLVTEYFEPDPGAANEQGVTPILLACREECPVEMIIYLMEHSVQNDSVSALEFAVFNNCVDLAKALITYEANYNALLAKTFTTALYLAITRTGNLELLQYMLDAPNNAVYSFVTEKYGEFTGLEEFARKASYELEKKITCFKILFNVLHSNAYTSDPVRYNVNDILRVALLSSETTSLIPYFIETERQWETRPLISSLYERLLPNYGLLALTVLCTCGPITIDKEELDPILK
uniref:ANK_REP_REGION domain-containing protein n=1 Tax=Anopheles christyi TaxID=43041 RepID=A0A182KDJ0_9DIPT